MITSVSFRRRFLRAMRSGPYGTLRLAVLASIAGLLLVVPCNFAQVPPDGVPIGSTPRQALHYATVATKEQAQVTSRTARTWTRQANSASYRLDQLQMDYRTMQFQFERLRQRFNWMGNLALQMDLPYARNALAELDGGLTIISELFIFIDNQHAAGTLDRATLVRTCRAFENSLELWEDELRKACSRMGAR